MDINISLFKPVVLYLLLSLCDGQSVADRVSLPFTGTACEGRPLDIICPAGYVLQINEARFGRQENSTCLDDLPTDSTKATDVICDVSGVLERVTSQCQENYCFLDTSADILDPSGDCGDIFSYLNVALDCVLPVEHVQSCAATTVTLSCPANTVIHVLDAFYGRLDNTTCSSTSVTSSNESCTNSHTANAAVGLLCNGKSSCLLEVGEALLGADCGGELKYLDVNFSCASCFNEFGNDEGCEDFERDGECQANPPWMTAYCRQACFGCRYTDICINAANDTLCDVMASRGQCEDEAVRTQCLRSCNRCEDLVDTITGKLPPEFTETCEAIADKMECPEDYFLRVDNAFFGREQNDTCASESVIALDCTSPDGVLGKVRKVCEGRPFCWFEPRPDVFGDPCPGNAKMGRVDYTCQRCHNAFADSECERRATLGECESNRGFMMENCFRTCTNCYTNVDCYNTHANDVDCDFWAGRDGCEYRSWMYYNCEEACQSCPDFTPTFPDSNYEVVCDEERVSLTCPLVNQFISVDNVFFGRNTETVCPHTDGNVTDCPGAPGATETVGEVCGGRHECSFEANPLSWGDPCPGVNKLARVQYHCQVCDDVYTSEFCEAKAARNACRDDYHFMQKYCFKTCSKCDQQACGNTHTNASDCDLWAMRGECSDETQYEWLRENCAESCGYCNTTNITDPTTVIPDETEVMTLGECEAGVLPVTCPDGYFIDIKAMFFGMSSLDACPTVSANTTQCEAHGAADIVKETCNGKAECAIAVHNVVFGDPCPGTSKQGSVDYTCHTCLNAVENSYCEYRRSAFACTWDYDAMMRDCFKTCSRCAEHTCENTHSSVEDCYYWAMSGECESNPVWMYANCREACNLCQAVQATTEAPTTSPSSDLLDKQDPVFVEGCEADQLVLSCEEGYHIRLDLIYFGRYSNESCSHPSVPDEPYCPAPDTLFGNIANLCNGRSGTCYYELLASIHGDPCKGVSKQGHAQYTCQKCVNLLSDSECEQKRDAGECDTDYINMMENCFKTCTVCDEAVCDNNYATAVDCDFWALTNNCATNPAFMFVECEASCGACVDKTCPTGFKGEGCTEFDCSLVNDCSGRGQCTGANTCTCISGFQGSNCTEYACNGINNCSGNGRCYGPNKCLCYPFFSGVDCGECNVDFEAGPNCMPCPNCDHGSCVHEQYPTLRGPIDVTPTQNGGVYKTVHREGVGSETPQPGDTLYTHYYGTLTDGTLFDASRLRGNMFMFKINTGYVIEGWELALPTMKRGEVATLTIRADYAYASAGLGSSIPPDATLLIRVELFDFRDTCSDVWSRDSCMDRLGNGECESNPDLMGLYCERTCKFCGEPESYPADCQNIYTPEVDCVYWSGIGECTNNMDWMLYNCHKACNGCGNQCTNSLENVAKDEDCDYWAKIGECDLVNRNWMLQNCRRSCGFCDWPPPNTDKCTNEHISDVNCDFWARNGECDIAGSRPWMRLMCRKSCGMCEAIPAAAVESYLGCFADRRSDEADTMDFEHLAWTDRNTTSAGCISECRNLGYKYAATRNGNQCLCGNTYGSFGEARGECVVPCQGTLADYCGGAEVNNVQETANAVWQTFEGRCECESDMWDGETCDQPTGSTSTTSPSPTTTTTIPSSTTTGSVPSSPTITTARSTTTTTMPPSTSPTTTPTTSTTRTPSTSPTTTPTTSTTRPTSTSPTNTTTSSSTTTTTSPTTITSSSSTLTSTTTSPTTTTSASTATSVSTTTVRTDTEATVAVSLEIRLSTTWLEEYSDMSNAVTQQFAYEVRNTLLEYYQRKFPDAVDVIIIGFREGSVIVEHELVFSSSSGATVEPEAVICDQIYDLREGQQLGDGLQASNSREYAGECSWQRNYCENDGELYQDSNGDFKCNCKLSTSGERCEDQELLVWQIVLIAVGCALVLVCFIAICVCIHMRNRSKSQSLL